MEYEVIQILDLVEVIGENAAQDILSGFSCPLNQEIEHFLKNRAIDFARRKMSITHLVFNADGRFVAFFTLAHKPIIVSADGLSRTAQRKMEKYAKFDEAIHAFNASAFLIAQFGKNYAVQDGAGISGDVLMDLVYDALTEIQHQIGGGIVFLECEDREKLIQFYESETNRFRRFGERYSEGDGVKYIQLLRFL